MKNPNKEAVSAIGKRAAQEVLMIWDTFADATRAIGCSMNAIYAWNHGRAAPNSVLLAKLYEHGADGEGHADGNAAGPPVF